MKPSFLNVEIKAICSEPDRIREILQQQQAVFRGTDFQTDTYFNCDLGRLKLREGNIEKQLIFYQRTETPGPRDSVVSLYKPADSSALKNILTKAFGQLVVVQKRREIYFIDNVKFHLDLVDGLGSFVEIEAIDGSGEMSREKLLEQCTHYMKLLEIKEPALINCSYSDLLIRKRENRNDI